MIPPTNLKDIIVGIIKDSAALVSPSDLEKEMIKIGHGVRKDIRLAVRDLVEENVLEYMDKHGKTHLALSFRKPVRLSRRIVVSPPDLRSDSISENTIKLHMGTAFGKGDHPTTQLCVCALDDIMADAIAAGKKIESALDIGTGTGILAMAASILGVTQVTACDRDPMSENEARMNVRLNGLSDRIFITGVPDWNSTYDIIIANLRYPTLLDLQSKLIPMTKQGSALVFSGIKKTEIDIVHDLYLKNDVFKLVWSGQRGGWCGVVYQKW